MREDWPPPLAALLAPQVKTCWRTKTPSSSLLLPHIGQIILVPAKCGCVLVLLQQVGLLVSIQSDAAKRGIWVHLVNCLPAWSCLKSNLMDLSTAQCSSSRPPRHLPTFYTSLFRIKAGRPQCSNVRVTDHFIALTNLWCDFIKSFNWCCSLKTVLMVL